MDSSREVKKFVKALTSSMSSPIRASQTPQRSSTAPNRTSKTARFTPNPPSWPPWVSSSNLTSRFPTCSRRSAIPPTMHKACSDTNCHGVTFFAFHSCSIKP
ncbi:hypothetical protein AMTRI_Chr06g194610 [Amborella trichopoda]